MRASSGTRCGTPWKRSHQPGPGVAEKTDGKTIRKREGLENPFTEEKEYDLRPAGIAQARCWYSRTQAQ